MRTCDFCGKGDRSNSVKVEGIQWVVKSKENTTVPLTEGKDVGNYEACPKCLQGFRESVAALFQTRLLENQPKGGKK